jgi:hypothetical protein
LPPIQGIQLDSAHDLVLRPIDNEALAVLAANPGKEALRP